jgi:hypothetical protein
MVLGKFTGIIGSYAGFLVATIWVGYEVNQDLVNGAVHGAVVGVAAGTVSTILMISMGAFLIGSGSAIMSFGLMGIIIGLMIDGIIGMVGGSVGAAI